MGDMPDEFYMYCTKDVFDWEETIETDEPNLTGYKQKAKYTRSDMHEAELAKLRNALDVAEKALEGAIKSGDTMGWSFEEQRQALTVIKQARGEG